LTVYERKEGKRREKRGRMEQAPSSENDRFDERAQNDKILQGRASPVAYELSQKRR